MVLTKQISEKFVEYYSSLRYQTLPRAPMLHPSVPMSFVMSAGLVQVETSLAQNKVRQHDRFVLVQSCFRHFDLDKIGKDDFHLSFFEMPGAFVFGSNYESQTIEHMWNLITVQYGINAGDLWVTYFAGDNIHGFSLPADNSAYEIWRKIGVPENRIIGLGIPHNYWIQGDGINGTKNVRKSGPNTEIFYDRGGKLACNSECRPGCLCGRFLEISNTLFIKNEINLEGGSINILEEPFTETVIGTERVAMVLQDAASIFDTDQFRLFLAHIYDLIPVSSLPAVHIMYSTRILADHFKALYCLVSDGAPPPGKNGRERLIKILIRRVLTQLIMLEIDFPSFFHSMADLLSREVNEFTPTTKEKLYTYFCQEKGRFLKTVERGQKKLDHLLEGNNGLSLSKAQIIELEKRMGYPVQLISLNLQKRGVDFPQDS